jgi:hypothetical protein
MRYLAAILLVLLLAAAACSSTDPASTSDGTQASSSDGGSSPEALDITFDGSECVYAGPGVLSAGDHAFLFTNSSGLGGKLEIDSITEGHTYQEALDVFAAGPQRPDWLTNEPVSFDRSSAPDIDLAANQTLTVRTLSIGSDSIAVYKYRDNERVWACGQIEVTE